MLRTCLSCGQYLARGLSPVPPARHDRQGLVVFSSTCPHCDRENVYVEVERLGGETDGAYFVRKQELDQAVRDLRPHGVAVVLVERSAVATG
jgi:hypothetical protein